jgi:hypothetical protein
MRNTRRTISKGERPKLHVATAVFFRIVSAKHQAKKWQLVGVRGKLPRLGMLELRKDSSAHYLLIHHAAVEFAAG